MNASAPRRSRSLAPIAIVVFVVVAMAAITLWVRSRQTTDLTPAIASVETPEPSTATGEPARAARTDAGGQRVVSQASRDAAMRSVQQRRERRNESVKRGEEMQKKIAAQFDSEKVDRAWAPGKETSLEKISSLPQVATSVAAPRSMAVDCRSSMCRISSAFDSNGNAEDWTMLYMASVGDALPNAVVSRVTNPDGSTTVNIYGRGR